MGKKNSKSHVHMPMMMDANKYMDPVLKSSKKPSPIKKKKKAKGEKHEKISKEEPVVLA